MFDREERWFQDIFDLLIHKCRLKKKITQIVKNPVQEPLGISVPLRPMFDLDFSALRYIFSAFSFCISGSQLFSFSVLSFQQSSFRKKTRALNDNIHRKRFKKSHEKIWDT